jgi:quinoprotein glucose dehydrogenase
LSQIRADNVGQLRITWRWSARNQGAEPPRQMQVSPLVIDGVLYTTAGDQRNVVAIDAATGETLWMWRPGANERRWADIIEPVARSAGRGVSYWTDGAGDQRIFVVTPSYQLVALNARTGRQIEGFGTGGVVDMVQNLRWDKRPGTNLEGRVSNTSPPAILGNVLVASITGHTGSVPTRSSPNEVWPMNLPEDVVAYDVRTGKRLWRFHTIPEGREYGTESWLKADPSLWNVPVGTHNWVKEHPELLDASWKYTGNAGFWAPVTADAELGYFYIATESPTNDYFGGYRPGENLFANSILALKAETGELVWHFQVTHHELWDYDIPTAPILVDVEVRGVRTKALAQITKQGFVFVLNRETGRPIWPVEERKVPASDVPGEWTSSTQPFSALSFDRQGLAEDDLIDYTPELRAAALKAVAGYRLGSLYTPPSLVNAPDATKGTLTLPGGGGLANWPGGAVDPETGILYVISATNLGVFAVMEGTKGTGVRYHIARVPSFSIQGLPPFKPPYSRITAIDLKTGRTLWVTPNGDTPEFVRNHPALKNVNIPKTGKFTRSSGLLVTSTLLFGGEGSGGDPILWAYNKMTGAAVGKFELPGPTTGFPITYMKDGRQFIVVAVRVEDAVELVALALPK